VSREKKVDHIQPRARGRREVEHESRVAAQRAQDLRTLVRGVVIQDHADHLAGGDLALNGVGKADEFLCRWRCMQWPITLPSNMSKAAKRVVVPWRL
jgi:hypothetical protein